MFIRRYAKAVRKRFASIRFSHTAKIWYYGTICADSVYGMPSSYLQHVPHGLRDCLCERTKICFCQYAWILGRRFGPVFPEAICLDPVFVSTGFPHACRGWYSDGRYTLYGDHRDCTVDGTGIPAGYLSGSEGSYDQEWYSADCTAWYETGSPISKKSFPATKSACHGRYGADYPRKRILHGVLSFSKSRTDLILFWKQQSVFWIRIPVLNKTTLSYDDLWSAPMWSIPI